VSYQGFRPPYAEENIQTGYSGVVLRPSVEPQQYYQEPEPYYYEDLEPAHVDDAYYEPENFEHDEIEPTETDIGDAADLDEGTVIGT